MTQFTGAPIFDADQHMYETPDSLTKYLPEKYSRAVHADSWVCRSPIPIRPQSIRRHWPTRDRASNLCWTSASARATLP